MELRLATQLDKHGLYALWQEAFGDSKETINLFFDAADYKNIPVISENGKIVSALYLIPTEIVSGSKKFSAYYIYAAATLKSQRKKGLMAKLLEFCSQLAKDRNIDYLFLKPEEEKLFNYYEKQGFKTAFYETEKRLYKCENIKKYSYVNWNTTVFELECKFNETELFKSENGLAELETDTDSISVIAFLSENANKLFNDIKKAYPENDIFIGLPSDSKTGIKTGMLKKINDNAENPDNIYLGICLQ